MLIMSQYVFKKAYACSVSTEAILFALDNLLPIYSHHSRDTT